MSNGKTIGLIKAIGGGGSVGGGNAVQYIPQELTEEQQMQARKNLGLYYRTADKFYLCNEQMASLVYTETFENSQGNVLFTDGVLAVLPDYLYVVVNGETHKLAQVDEEVPYSTVYGNGFLRFPFLTDTGEDIALDLDSGVFYIKGNVPEISFSAYTEENVKVINIPEKFIPRFFKPSIVSVTDSVVTTDLVYSDFAPLLDGYFADTKYYFLTLDGGITYISCESVSGKTTMTYGMHITIAFVGGYKVIIREDGGDPVFTQE